MSLSVDRPGRSWSSLPVRHTPATAAIIPCPVLVPFSGKREKHAKSMAVEALLKQLKVDEWFRQLGLRMWRIRIKEADDSIRLEVDTADSQAGVKLSDVQKELRTKDPKLAKVELEERSIRKCCHSGCNGCLNYPLNADWVGQGI